MFVTKYDIKIKVRIAATRSASESCVDAFSPSALAQILQTRRRFFIVTQAGFEPASPNPASKRCVQRRAGGRPIRWLGLGGGETLSDASRTVPPSGLSAQRAQMPDAEAERELTHYTEIQLKIKCRALRGSGECNPACCLACPGTAEDVRRVDRDSD